MYLEVVGNGVVMVEVSRSCFYGSPAALLAATEGDEGLCKIV